MQPRFRTVFEEDLFGAGCASSIELLSERVFRPFFERFFFFMGEGVWASHGAQNGGSRDRA